jgi:hypothetical protein
VSGAGAAEEARVLRVVVLQDAVHNAFFDRGYREDEQ